MSSHMIDILRQGVWASLTGGWYYEPAHTMFTNIFHLYTWLFLFSLPFFLHMMSPKHSWHFGLIYSGIVLAFFVVLKSINGLLHTLFDSAEMIEETDDIIEEGRDFKLVETDVDEQAGNGIVELASNGPASHECKIGFPEVSQCGGLSFSQSSGDLSSFVSARVFEDFDYAEDVSVHNQKRELFTIAEQSIEEEEILPVIDFCIKNNENITENYSTVNNCGAIPKNKAAVTEPFHGEERQRETLSACSSVLGCEGVDGDISVLRLNRSGLKDPRPVPLYRRDGFQMQSTSILGNDEDETRLLLDVLNGARDQEELKKFNTKKNNSIEDDLVRRDDILDGSWSSDESCNGIWFTVQPSTDLVNEVLVTEDLDPGSYALAAENSPMASETTKKHVRHPQELARNGQAGDESYSLRRFRNSSRLGPIGETHFSNSCKPKISKFYLVSVPYMKTSFKICLDRLQLMDILDPDSSLWMSLLSIELAVITSILGFMVLSEGYYHDSSALIFCFVLSSCQYSLLKSVQPDPSSPSHGFNITPAFSRPVYFSFICGLVLLLEFVAATNLSGFRLYGDHQWMCRVDVLLCLDLLYGFILAFPIIFTIGLLPQISTALMVLLEETDIHLFGGNPAISLLGSAYCVARSLLAVMVVFGFAFAGLEKPVHFLSTTVQEVLFSFFCSLCVVFSYLLSRSSADPAVNMLVIKKLILEVFSEETLVQDTSVTSRNDPQIYKLRDTIRARLVNDALFSLPVAVLVLLLHQSGLFTSAFPYLDLVLWFVAALTGFLLHYLLPQLRRPTPWKCFSEPFLASHEQDMFEVREAAQVMWWEKVLLLSRIIEQYIMYPLIFISAATHDRLVFQLLFGNVVGSLFMSITLLKCLRCVFSNTSNNYFTLVITVLFFQYTPDTYLFILSTNPSNSSPFLLDYFLVHIFLMKFNELYLKFQFILTYIAPHQLTWGSAFNAFAQPLSLPHSSMLFLQAVISTIISGPLNPFLGSSIFICSYFRPVKFWEKDYNTKRSDNSNTRLASQVDPQNTLPDENNLNCIFYEHLTRSLQESLAGDLMMGRWGSVEQGDCFIMASDNLNCLVHIIEVGNGLCTFQLRGLEFLGTYCQQREVEAITEELDEGSDCPCCRLQQVPPTLSVSTIFNQKFLAWEVVAAKYVLEGYSISDNSAHGMLQVNDLKKVLVTYFIKCIIYYTIKSAKLEDWLQNETIIDATTRSDIFVDSDPRFNSDIDEDFESRSSGITLNSFCKVFLDWIQHCCQTREQNIRCLKNSPVTALCFSLSLVGRRALYASSVNLFLSGLYDLFKGDIRISSQQDEWVFSDMELLQRVVCPAVRMSLKLHQDHFLCPDEYEECSILVEAIKQHEQNLVIAHEGDPVWRKAVLSGASSLLSLRHVMDEGMDKYKVIMLNKRYLSFRLIKLNKECVRGLWAGQQQELIFLRNRNSERGSIQMARQVLRNMINSSCDQPIGYPIFVSPLTISYSDTHAGVTRVLGMSSSMEKVRCFMQTFWARLIERCVASCGSSGPTADCDNTKKLDKTSRTIKDQGSLSATLPSKPHQDNVGRLAGIFRTSSFLSADPNMMELQPVHHQYQEPD